MKVVSDDNGDGDVDDEDGKVMTMMNVGSSNSPGSCWVSHVEMLVLADSLSGLQSVVRVREKRPLWTAAPPSARRSSRR